jgi:Lon-like ATP-dependent protease
VSDELDKLSGLEPVSPEFNVTRTYLEWLTSLPWGVYSQEIFDIQHAQQVGMAGCCSCGTGMQQKAFVYCM